MEVDSLSRKKGISGLVMAAPSGYSVLLNPEKCKACGKCVKLCHYGAMSILEVDGKKKLSYSKDQCMGCGVCLSVCNNEAVSLVVDPTKGKVFDIDAMVEQSRKQLRVSG
jgi:MinD superfamily P-loop ATPase